MKHTFVKGQIVTCNRSGVWVDARGIESEVPRKDDTCVIAAMHRHPVFRWQEYVTLLGIPGYFNAEFFTAVGELSTVARCR